MHSQRGPRQGGELVLDLHHATFECVNLFADGSAGCGESAS